MKGGKARPSRSIKKISGQKAENLAGRAAKSSFCNTPVLVLDYGEREAALCKVTIQGSLIEVDDILKAHAVKGIHIGCEICVKVL